MVRQNPSNHLHSTLAHVSRKLMKIDMFIFLKKHKILKIFLRVFSFSKFCTYETNTTSTQFRGFWSSYPFLYCVWVTKHTQFTLVSAKFSLTKTADVQGKIKKHLTKSQKTWKLLNFLWVLCCRKITIFSTKKGEFSHKKSGKMIIFGGEESVKCPASG